MKKPTVVIAPFAKKLRNGKVSAKNYPYWLELIKYLQEEHNVVQLGIVGEPSLVPHHKFNLSLQQIKELLTASLFWVSVDSFLPHLAHHINKKGVVLWGVSDPKIFGYTYNLNIIKDSKYFRKNQFAIWEDVEFSTEPFLEAKDVYELIKTAKW
jgi:ADP-heptose:LPS heptosyltransferase